MAGDRGISDMRSNVTGNSGVGDVQAVLSAQGCGCALHVRVTHSGLEEHKDHSKFCPMYTMHPGQTILQIHINRDHIIKMLLYMRIR